MGDISIMMTDPAAQASVTSGAAMDRRVAHLRRPWWRQPQWFGPPLALLGAALAWHVLPASGSTDIAAADIETGAVERTIFADDLPVRATVAPRLSTFVNAVSGGQVERLLVQDGSAVTAGEALATLANPSLKLDVMTREAQIASQLGSLSGDELALERSKLDRAGQTSSANYDLLKAERDLSIRQQLHDQGFVSDEGVKSYREETDYQRQRLAQLRSGQTEEDRTGRLQADRLAETRARLDGNLSAVRAGLDALVIRAPVAGRLTNFTIQPGQMLKAGDPAGQIDSEGSWKLVADVDEYYLGRVAVGQKATAEGGARLTVSRVLPSVTDGRFRIELAFDGTAPAGLNRGQTLDTRVTLGAASQSMVAPVGGWLDAGNGASAFVLDGDGRHARRRAIRIGRRNPEQVEILSGLAPGDRIVTSNTASVKGDILNIR
ncbi:efflux RND transporter periplasmic adaptor subunit [Sphingomonas abietis]|uniref:HlyD family efflux transporter periplasmic adaptor subunit n=1 Tax=Sphingomonas abietis TaxID=3012344 RepID=A0ABY7NMW4_9SPHN|nr:HlyD family efflux transporter periplasmic adaptor subunit [Sphingomonas abietis]WBO22325.1 HlyD family efflux transporter periplasmic adaptor subunit [Sphingomonas abietis]